MSQGWECPKCGGVYAPFVVQCDRCTLPSVTISSVPYTIIVCLFCGGNQNLPPRGTCSNPGFHTASYTSVSSGCNVGNGGLG